jgi:DNA-binding response OmpR family regulator
MQLQVLERGADAFVGKNEDPRLLCVHVQRLLMRARSRRAA